MALPMSGHWLCMDIECLAIPVKEVEALSHDGFIIMGQNGGSSSRESERGVLNGTFSFLRSMQTGMSGYP